MRKLIIILLFFPLLGFSQATATSRVYATIIRAEDTSAYFAQQRTLQTIIRADTIVEIGSSYRRVKQVNGEPVEIFKMQNNKQKLVYKNVVYYFKNREVDIIQKRKGYE